MLIIFDLDGTLLNTLGDLTAATNHALRVCGFAPHSAQDCCRFVGNGVTKLLERSLPQQSRTLANLAHMREAFFAYYDAHLWDHTTAYHAIGQVLETLQERGIKLAVASNKYQSATERLIRHFFPQIKFCAVLGQRANVPVKPHPQIVYDILAFAHEPCSHTWYVGDSDVDMQTAQNAGVKACGVTWGFRSHEILEAYHPACIIDAPQELFSLL